MKLSIVKPGISVLSILALLIITGSAYAGDIVWKSDFNNIPAANLNSTGSDTVVKVSNDSSTKNSSLTAKFTNKTDAKGMNIKFDSPIPVGSFKYLSFRYKLSSPNYKPQPYNPHVENPLFLVWLYDTEGNYWIARYPLHPVLDKYHLAAIKKGSFGFHYNEKDSGMKKAEMKADIAGIIISINPMSETDADFSLTVEKAELSNGLPHDAVAGEMERYITQTWTGIGFKNTGPATFPLLHKVDNLNKNGNFVVDGKPFFPLALYSVMGIDQASATHKEGRYTGTVTEQKTLERFGLVKKAGFNTLQTYAMQFYGMKVAKPGWDQSVPGDVIEDTTTEKLREGGIKFLDYAQKAGLKVIYGAYKVYSMPEGKDAVMDEKYKEAVKANIAAWKNHPALIAWYLIDEPSSILMPVRNLQNAYEFIKTQDTSHPELIASASPSDVQYLNAVDIMAPDPYPVETGNPFTLLADRLDSLRQYQNGTPAMPQLWAIVQISHWVKDARLPSTADIRLQSLLAFTRDVKGLLFYEHSNYPDTNPAQWENISQAVNSLHSIIPDMLASADIIGDYKISSDKIQSIMRKVTNPKTKQVYYSLIAVNPTQNMVLEPIPVGQVTVNLGNIELPKGSVVTVFDEDPSGNFKLNSRRYIKLARTSSGYNFSDTFGELASHVYRIGAAK